MAEDDPIQAGRDRRAALAAQRAAEAPSPEEARAAQRRANAPTSAEARAAQARAGNFVDSRAALADRGEAAWRRAVNENATRMVEPPQGRLTGYGSPSMPEPPAGRMLASGVGAAGAGSALRTGAGAVLRGATRIPGVDSIVNATPAARAQLTDTPEGRRILAEHEASRAQPSRADADMENPMPRPQMGNVIEREVAARKPRPNTRPNTRMSRREMSADELNEISQGVTRHRTGAESEPGSYGEIARNIAGRQRDIERQRELESMKRGGPVKKMASGGVVKSSASGRSDGCAVKGKTKGRMV